MTTAEELHRARLHEIESRLVRAENERRMAPRPDPAAEERRRRADAERQRARDAAALADKRERLERPLYSYTPPPPRDWIQAEERATYERLLRRLDAPRRQAEFDALMRETDEALRRLRESDRRRAEARATRTSAAAIVRRSLPPHSVAAQYAQLGFGPEVLERLRNAQPFVRTQDCKIERGATARR